MIMEFFESVGMFILVFCVIFGFCYIIGGKEQSVMNECEKIGDENTRISMELIKNQNEK